MTLYNENNERDQDRLDQTVNLFRRTGDVVYPENKQIYKNLSSRFSGKNILEIGCGIGWGAALIGRNNNIFATDKLPVNVQLSRSLYPWINFNTLDISICGLKNFDIVICIDVIEHIKEYRTAIRHIVDSGNEIWISTPNRSNKNIGDYKPYNDYHVKEFTISEMINMIGNHKVELYNWNDFKQVKEDSLATPMVYRICKKY